MHFLFQRDMQLISFEVDGLDVVGTGLRGDDPGDDPGDEIAFARCGSDFWF